MIENTVTHLLDSRCVEDASPINISHVFACEVDKRCQEELLILPNGPKCVFDNILDVTPDAYRSAVGIDGSEPAHPAYLRERLPTCTPKTHAWCIKHGKSCAFKTADVHVAGISCTDHSAMGKREELMGKSARVFYIWAAQRRQLREKMIITENVTTFGHEPFCALLGDLYEVARITLSPVQLGWATMRSRQFVFLFYKQSMYGVLREENGAKSKYEFELCFRDLGRMPAVCAQFLFGNV